MLKIKLSRAGKKNLPHYKIVVNEARSKRDGKFVEELGVYNPTTTPKTFKLDQKRLDFWLARGAKATPTVKRLLNFHAKAW